MVRQSKGSRARKRPRNVRMQHDSMSQSQRVNANSGNIEQKSQLAIKDRQPSGKAHTRSTSDPGTAAYDDNDSAVERVTFLTHPFKVSYYSSLYLKERLRSTLGYIVQYPRTLAYSAALGSIYTALHFVAGPHIAAFHHADAWVGWHLYWIFLGVLSSIGLGAGLHTFVLFLGPHIARVTLTAHECSGTAFSVHGPGAFHCAAIGTTSATFIAIMRKVIFESLCWGAGTAVGELPPYFIARAASAAGKGNVEYQRLRRKAAAGGSLSFKDRALLSIYRLLRRFGFAGILVFAAIPNPLFDLAGITCGHFKVPFWTFFGATFIGKSIFKSSLQTAVVVTAFSKEMIAVVLSFLSYVSPWARDMAEHILNKQAAAFNTSANIGFGRYGQNGIVDSTGSSANSLSFLGSVWNTCIAVMLIYFVISTLETFAQSYLVEVKSWGQNQLAKVGSLQRSSSEYGANVDG